MMGASHFSFHIDVDQEVVGHLHARRDDLAQITVGRWPKDVRLAPEAQEDLVRFLKKECRRMAGEITTIDDLRLKFIGIVDSIRMAVEGEARKSVA